MLGSAAFCILKSCLDVLLSFLQCETSVIPADRGLYSEIWILIWIPTIVTDPQIQSVLLAWVGNMLPACLFVFMACLYVMWLVC